MSTLLTIILVYVASVIMAFAANWAACRLNLAVVWTPGWVIPIVNTFIAFGLTLAVVIYTIAILFYWIFSGTCMIFNVPENKVLSSNYWTSRWEDRAL